MGTGVDPGKLWKSHELHLHSLHESCANQTWSCQQQAEHQLVHVDFSCRSCTSTSPGSRTKLPGSVCFMLDMQPLDFAIRRPHMCLKGHLPRTFDRLRGPLSILRDLMLSGLGGEG